MRFVTFLCFTWPGCWLYHKIFHLETLKTSLKVLDLLCHLCGLVRCNWYNWRNFVLCSHPKKKKHAQTVKQIFYCLEGRKTQNLRFEKMLMEMQWFAYYFQRVFNCIGYNNKISNAQTDELYYYFCKDILILTLPATSLKKVGQRQLQSGKIIKFLK